MFYTLIIWLCMVATLLGVGYLVGRSHERRLRRRTLRQVRGDLESLPLVKVGKVRRASHFFGEQAS